MNVGYARVSTQGQTLESQLEELGKADCSKIYSEKISGAKYDRPELQRLLKALEPGSVMVVTRLDRLWRSTIDPFTIIEQIYDRGWPVKSLADACADTTTPGGANLGRRPSSLSGQRLRSVSEWFNRCS